MKFSAVVFVAFASLAHVRATDETVLDRLEETSRMLSQSAALPNIGKGANTKQVVLALQEVQKSIESEASATGDLQKAAAKQCKSELQALKMSISKSDRLITSAKNDIKSTKAALAEVNSQIATTKAGIKACHTEMDSLAGKLDKLRTDYRKQAKLVQTSLSAIDSVVVYENSRSSSRRGASMLDTASNSQDARPHSSLVGVKEAVNTLEGDKDRVEDEATPTKAAFRKEEAKLMKLMSKQEKLLATKKQELGSLQPSKADKLESLAELERSKTSGTRSKDRDTKVQTVLTAKCKQEAESYTAEAKSRNGVYTSLKMAIALLNAIDGKKVLLQEDVQEVSELEADAISPPAFVQVGEETSSEESSSVEENAPDDAEDGSQDVSLLSQGDSTSASTGEGGPFDSVKKMIQDLITKMKAKENADIDKEKFCTKGKKDARKKEQDNLDTIDQKKAEIRMTKAAMKRIDDQVKFLKSEEASCKANEAKAKAELVAKKKRFDGLIKNNKAANSVVAKTVTITKQLCKLTGLFLQSKMQNTEKASNCKEAVTALTETVNLLVKQGKEYETLSSKAKVYLDKVVSKMKSAAAAKKGELSQAKSTKATRADTLAQAQTDLRTAKKEKVSNEKAKKVLEESCSPAVESFKDRQRRRQEEIDALKNALQVLEGETIPVALAQTGQNVATTKLQALQVALSKTDDPAVQQQLNGAAASALGLSL